MAIRTSLQDCPNETISKLQGTLGRTTQGLPRSTSDMVMRELRKVAELMSSRRKPIAFSTILKKGFTCIQSKEWIVKESYKNLGLVLMQRDVYSRLDDSELSKGVLSEVNSFLFEQIFSNLVRLTRIGKLPPMDLKGILDEAQ